MKVAALCVLAVVLAAATALPHKGVETLDDVQDVGEGTGVMVFMKAEAGAKKMWTKADQVPMGTENRKTIGDVDKHGQCRYACYTDKGCGGYSFVPASHTCTLLSAPNFLSGAKAANDAWHKAVAGSTGADYKPDEGEKEKDAMKGAINAMPKTKSHSVPKKAGDFGPLQLNLQSVTNTQLAIDADQNESGLGEKLDAQLTKYKGAIFMEFYEKFSHEFEHRAEANAKRKAEALVKKRVKKANIEEPFNKVDHDGKVKMYIQARKEVDNHAVRTMQRSFVKHLKKWANDKVFTEQERLKNAQDQAELDKEEHRMEAEEEINKAKVDGQDAPPGAEDAAAAPKKERDPITSYPAPTEAEMNADASDKAETAAKDDAKEAEPAKEADPAKEEPKL